MVNIPKHFAHRGTIDKENTLEGFGIALDKGALGIELDVHFYRDDLRVTHYKSQAKKAPLFSDVLTYIHKRCKELKRDKPMLNVDLKSRGTGRLVLKQIGKKWKAEDFLISSFMVLTGESRVRFNELKTVRELNKKIAIGIIGYSNVIRHYLHFIRELKACALITKYSDRYTKEFVDIVHKHKLASIAWGNNCEEALSVGADSVIKDVRN